MATTALTQPPRRKYVMLRSSDNHEFVLPVEAAVQSRMLADMLQGMEQLDLAADDDAAAMDGEDHSGSGGTRIGGTTLDSVLEIPLDHISAPVLQLVCHYLVEKESGRNTMSEFRALQSMDPTSESDKQLVLELLLAADYLDC